MTDETIVAFKGIGKRFPGVVALDGIDLSIVSGSCHGLVGENGAGKSTLGKILSGIYTPDTGQLELAGRAARFQNARDAMLAGIGMVHQELLFCENISVAENLSLGRTPRVGPFVARKQLVRNARSALDSIGARIDPGEKVGRLSVGQQQLVQIAAAVSRGARVLIFDEPTSSLSQYESKRLFELIARLKQDGVTIVYISHRLEEVFQLCDEITVLRDGRHVVGKPANAYTNDELVEFMIGRPLETYFPGHLSRNPGRERLRVEGLSLTGQFRDVSLSVRAGEVVGLAGLVGAGRTELAETLFGLRRADAGRILVDDRAVRIRTPRQAMRLGLGLVPEDRKRHGLVLPMNARENISLPLLDTLSRLGWVRREREHSLVNTYFERLRVRAPGTDTIAAGLSGGNQQKLVIARWLAAACGVLLLDEPTRGVDVGAKAEIHALVDELADAGAAILLISSELPEILNLSTRIIVLRNGQVAGSLDRDEATQDSVMRLMSGVGRAA